MSQPRWQYGSSAISPVSIPRYIYGCFESAPVLTEKLFILNSQDGITWTQAPVDYIPADSGNGVRDPSIAYNFKTDTIWLVHTNTLAADFKKFSVAVSANHGRFFYPTTEVDMSAVVSGANALVWSPEWAHAEDGSLWLDGTGLPHVFVAASSTGTSDTGFQLYEVHPGNVNDWSQPWSVPVQVTGTSLPNNMIDPYPLVDGATISMWYKNENTKFVEVMSTTLAALTSGYTIARSGDWAGWGGPLEGMGPIRMSMNQWRIYLDAQGSGMYYSDSFNNVTGYDAGVPYTAKALITSPFTVQHGTVIARQWNQ